MFLRDKLVYQNPGLSNPLVFPHVETSAQIGNKLIIVSAKIQMWGREFSSKCRVAKGILLHYLLCKKALLLPFQVL
jgi:hypothetical protein